MPKKGKVPTEEELQKEIVKVLNGVNVLEFNIKMLMKHLSKPHTFPWYIIEYFSSGVPCKQFAPMRIRLHAESHCTQLLPAVMHTCRLLNHACAAVSDVLHTHVLQQGLSICPCAMSIIHIISASYMQYLMQ